jgi:hypothetical protein
MQVASDPDPSMESLVPRSSRRRNSIAVALAIILLAVVWWSPRLLRPEVESAANGQGSWTALASHRQVLVDVSLVAHGWPSARVERVRSVRGARVAGAWISVGPGIVDIGTGDPDAFDDGESYLSSLLGEPLADLALPQSIDDGAEARLFVLWDILDCTALAAAHDPETDGLSVALRTPIGTEVDSTLDAIGMPGFDVETLQRSGACPDG